MINGCFNPADFEPWGTSVSKKNKKQLLAIGIPPGIFCTALLCTKNKAEQIKSPLLRNQKSQLILADLNK